MPSVSGGDHDGIDVVTCHKLTQIVVRVTAPIRPTRPRGRVRLLDRLLGVLAAPPVHVAGGDDLRFGIPKAAAQMPATHHANADETECNPLARCHGIPVAQHDRGHDGGSGQCGTGRCGPLQKLPAVATPVC